MTRSQVADGGDNIQLWSVTANTLDKQPRTEAKGMSSSLGLAVRLACPHCKIYYCYEALQ
jgi:hypothetical protein